MEISSFGRKSGEIRKNEFFGPEGLGTFDGFVRTRSRSPGIGPFSIRFDTFARVRSGTLIPVFSIFFRLSLLPQNPLSRIALISVFLVRLLKST